VVDDVGRELAGGRLRVMSWPPGARTISILTKGKRLLNALMISCSTSVKSAV
jgi:hypothetical protein